MKMNSLQARISLLTVGLITTAFVVSTLLQLRNEQSLIIQQTEISRSRLTETFAVSITNALLYEELGLIEEGGLIENYIEEWIGMEDLPIRYIQVTNREGRVIASSRFREYGVIPADSLSRLVIASTSTIIHRVRSEDDEPILDVATPLNIATRSWGHIRVGYSLQPLQAQIKRIRYYHAILSIVFIAVGSIIIAYYVNHAMQPLGELRDFVIKVGEETWQRAPVRRNDEIGELAQTFNTMLDQIEQGRELERDTQEKFHQTEKIATIGKLAAGIAHEVRNPLAGILNLVENMKRYRVDPDKQMEYVDVIEKGLKRIEKTVDGLVSFARQAPFSPGRTNPADLINETLHLVEYPVRKGNITIEKEYETARYFINADADQVRQVLLNIILNAIQALEHGGGKIAIRVVQIPPAQVAIEIEDDGIGIPKEHLSRIFDPFYTTQPLGKGTGLGLAVSKSIIQRHGGTLSVKSEEGRGTKFTIILPEAM